MTRRVLLVVAALACGAACVGLAQGARSGRTRIVASDQAAARRAVVRLADLPAGFSWKQEAASPPSGSSGVVCPGYTTSVSGLVTTGQAASKFAAQGIMVTSDAELLSTASMVTRDWQHTFTPGLAGCLRRAFEQGAEHGGDILSVRRMAFPGLAAHTTGYRIEFQITSAGKPVRGLLDLIALAGRRTEVELFVFALLGPPSRAAAGEAIVTAIDEQVAGAVARRAFASSGLAA